MIETANTKLHSLLWEIFFAALPQHRKLPKIHFSQHSSYSPTETICYYSYTLTPSPPQSTFTVQCKCGIVCNSMHKHACVFIRSVCLRKGGWLRVGNGEFSRKFELLFPLFWQMFQFKNIKSQRNLPLKSWQFQSLCSSTSKIKSP